MAVFIQLIVGELELVEGDDLFHPLSALGGGVWVHVDAGRGVGVLGGGEIIIINPKICRTL